VRPPIHCSVDPLFVVHDELSVSDLFHSSELREERRKKGILAAGSVVLVVAGCGNSTDPKANDNYNLKIRGNKCGKANDICNRSVVEYFSIGSSRQDVFDTLGNPDAIFYGTTTCQPGVDNDKDAYFVYTSVGLSFRIFGSTVREITLLSSDWIASNGLIVGMSRSDMSATGILILDAVT
jgi:hypothetical protein